MIRYNVLVDPYSAPPDYVVDFSQTRTTICMGFASFMILIWEHIITFSDEVNYVWKGTKGPIVYLFFLNRYLTPFGFIINLFAYLSPSWTPERCSHFVRYEGSMTVIGLNTTALMMFLRVYAMYPGKILVLTAVASMFIIELTVNAWLLTHGQSVIHNRSIHACTMIFNPSVGHIASASAWLPLLYDTLVLTLTINRTIKPVRHKTAGHIMKVLLRDGILYYSVIFAVNLVLSLMIGFAPPGIQNITAQLEYLLTVAMMSRITIHLKKQGRLAGLKGDILDTASPTSQPATTHIPLSTVNNHNRHSRLSQVDFASPHHPDGCRLAIWREPIVLGNLLPFGGDHRSSRVPTTLPEWGEPVAQPNSLRRSKADWIDERW